MAATLVTVGAHAGLRGQSWQPPFWSPTGAGDVGGVAPAPVEVWPGGRRPVRGSPRPPGSEAGGHGLLRETPASTGDWVSGAARGWLVGPDRYRARGGR